jgi:hypothetical protein
LGVVQAGQKAHEVQDTKPVMPTSFWLLISSNHRAAIN